MGRLSSRKTDDEETTLQGSSETSGSLARSQLSTSSVGTNGTIEQEPHAERVAEPRAASRLGDVQTDGSSGSSSPSG